MHTIKTDRLIIQEATLAYDQFFVKLMNSPGWLQYIGDRGIRHQYDAQKYIKHSLHSSYQKNKYGLYLVIEQVSNTPIGICGLLQRTYLTSPDIGFAILPAYEGKGYITEAGIAVIEDARVRLGIETVMGITIPGNKGSQRVLEKLGLRFSKEIERSGETLWLYSI